MEAASGTGDPLKGDVIAWFLVTTHGLLGHDKLAAVLGDDPGPREECKICAWENYPSAETKADLQAALDPAGDSGITPDAGEL